MIYSTKNYPPTLGLSACFRQWRADSHCRYIHGYALGFRFIFKAKHLDKNGWVVDFGGLGKLKQELVDRFDHRVLVAQDDPEIDTFMRLSQIGLARIIVMDGVGCEAFARQMFEVAQSVVNDERVRVVSCECYEHDGNSAIYEET